MIQPLPIGNALRLFIQPPAGAVRWKVLKKGSNSISSHDDPTAALAYDGDENVIVDASGLQNEVMMFYRPFYTADGIIWTPGPVANGTPAATYTESTTDVLTHLRDRLEAGLLVEVQRGNLFSELGYVQVYTASPSLERDLRFPLVTVHLESENAGERGLGDDVGLDIADTIGGTLEEGEGWLADVNVTFIGWSQNADERLELRKALRRVIIGNLPVFAALGWVTPSLSQSDVDAVGGEYPSPIYQVMNTFTCVAPVRVAGEVATIREITARSIDV